MIRKSLIIVFICLLTHSFGQVTDKPKVCFTFDDGSTADLLTYKNADWNALILKQLKQEQVQAVFFACGKGLNGSKGDSLLSTWDNAGHLIANHTFSHRNYHNPAVTFQFFRADFLKNDSLIRKYHHYTRLFRFPMLKEGNTIAKRDSFRLLMKEKGYSNGYVTIDASDWYYNSCLIEALKENPYLDLEPYRKAYLAHILDRATYYDSLAYVLTGRRIHHSLLLHHNLTSALFLGDLIKLFKEKGWAINGAEETYRDTIYTMAPNTLPAGESLVWAMAKADGRFDKVLRYPAEDGEYEKNILDKLKK
jgi:peptidoglycan/xylan/chitin deacetylase (PgdA/CDA1 family)